METNLNYDTSTKKNFDLKKSPLVTITRFFNAPMEKVWQAWSNEELVKEWWGPEGYSAPYAKIDFRVGGKSLLAMKDPKGEVIYSGGVYKEIIPFKKIVTTDHFADKNGKIIPASEAGMPGEWPLDCLITIEFSDGNEEQVKIIINHEGIPKAMHDDCVEGWNSSIDKFQRLVESH